MHLMIATGGGRMAEDVRHEMRLSDIRRIEGMAHYDRKSLKPLFEELRAAVLTYDDPEAMCYTIGGLLDQAVVDGQAVLDDMGVTMTSGMPTFDRILKDDDIAAILAFIKSSWPARIRAIQAERNGG